MDSNTAKEVELRGMAAMLRQLDDNSERTLLSKSDRVALNTIIHSKFIHEDLEIISTRLKIMFKNSDVKKYIKNYTKKNTIITDDTKESAKKSDKKSAKKSDKESAKKSDKESAKKSTKESDKKSTKESAKKSTKESDKKPTKKSDKESTKN